MNRIIHLSLCNSLFLLYLSDNRAKAQRSEKRGFFFVTSESMSQILGEVQAHIWNLFRFGIRCCAFDSWGDVGCEFSQKYMQLLLFRN